MAKRRLSEDEIKQAREARRAKELAKHPNARVVVRVEEETDDAGEPIVSVNITGTSEMPKDWKP